jgi:hypothetical protein
VSIARQKANSPRLGRNESESRRLSQFPCPSIAQRPREKTRLIRAIDSIAGISCHAQRDGLIKAHLARLQGRQPVTAD